MELIIANLFTIIIRRKSLTAKFDKLDANNDGKLSVDYATKLVVQETKMDEYDAKCLVHAADTSNDGNISKDEFIKMWSDFC